MLTFYKTIVISLVVLCLCEQVRLAPLTSPPSARYQPAIVYDSGRKRVILFGGIEKSGQHLGDTWEWDGMGWIKVSEAGPPARSGHALAYDGQRRKVLLFGGVSKSGALGDLWGWDGKTWTEIKTLNGPAARVAAQMVYDTRRRRVVLFGGLDSANKRNFADTWEWDDKLWARVSVSGPAGRFHHCMVYDAARRKVVLFGGNVAEGVLSSEKY